MSSYTGIVYVIVITLLIVIVLFIVSMSKVDRAVVLSPLRGLVQFKWMRYSLYLSLDSDSFTSFGRFNLDTMPLCPAVLAEHISQPKWHKIGLRLQIQRGGSDRFSDPRKVLPLGNDGRQ